MSTQFERVAFTDIEAAVRRHLGALPTAIDSYLEDHILASRHYRIEVADQPAGFASVHGGSLITQFALDEPWRHLGQSAFAQVRHLEDVRFAFVPTCDEFYLAHALDEYRQLTKQAYNFALAADRTQPAPNSCALRPAKVDDLDLVKRESGDFFDPVERYIEQRELFVTLRDGESVGFGLLVPSALYHDVASIGMFTIERCRGTGAGTATIAMLIEECQRRGLRPVAGCWYYNHASKRTLERAGMFAGSRLLRVEY